MLRILLVEDEPHISELAAAVLEDAGHQVAIASDGLDGLGLARREMPELIITDFSMPRMSGLEMIESMRASGYGNPIILTTASPEDQLPRRPGYDAFLPKPYRLRALVELVERLRGESLRGSLNYLRSCQVLAGP
jgi:CheY-like chemotaxis protein